MSSTSPFCVQLQLCALVLVGSLLTSFNSNTITMANAQKVHIPRTAPMTYPCDSSTAIGMEQSKLFLSLATGTFNSSSYYAYGVSENCYKCLHLPLSLQPLRIARGLCVLVDTQHEYTIGISHEKPFSGCKSQVGNETCAWEPSSYVFNPFTNHFKAGAAYNIVVYDDYEQHYEKVHQTKNVDDKYIPLYVVIAVVIFLCVLHNFRALYVSRTKEPSYDEYLFTQEVGSANRNQPASKHDKKKDRVISIDAFRGMCLIVMIFVNSGGGGYWWLDHSTWNGLTVADLVFPWFVFIMGTAMGIVFPRKLAKIENSRDSVHINLASHSVSGSRPTLTKGLLMKRVCIRGFKLFALGMILNNGHDLKTWRIPGVLQYFGVAYAVNGLLIIATEPSAERVKDGSSPEPRNCFVPEVALYLPQWLVSLLIVIGNLFVVYFVPVTLYGESCPKGYFGPGGIGDHGQHIQCTGGAHRYVDYQIFGAHHVYQSPTARDYYGTGWYDPEGVLGMMTASFLCFLGIFAGRVLVVYQEHQQRMVRWMVTALLFGALAGGFCTFEQDGGLIPVNKNLWSLSFIFCQASTGIMVLVLFYALIDIFKFWDGKPFHWLGQNSIVLYVGSEILGGYFPWSFSDGAETHTKLLLSNCVGVLCWIVIAWYLFKNKIFYNI